MTRTRMLPAGWYPTRRDEVESLLSRFESEIPACGAAFVAVIVPHAGWTFSGRFAYRGIRCIDPGVETVVVVGGHLSAASRPLLAPESAFDTPFGPIRADRELSDVLSARFELGEDTNPDNTVEVHLPFVAALFPRAKLVWARAPSSMEAARFGRAIAEAADTLGRKVAVIGSTDLTHYGAAYHFAPVGSGRSAVEWVRNTNDAGMVDRLAALDIQGAVEYANDHRAACSVGGAAAAMAYAAFRGVTGGSVLDYGTSLDVYGAGDSFVGYAAVGFPLSQAVSRDRRGRYKPERR